MPSPIFPSPPFVCPPQVVLLHVDGTTITRDGKTLIKLATACQSAIDERDRDGDLKRELTKVVARESASLKELEAKLASGPAAALRAAYLQLELQMRPGELAEFLSEPAVPEAQADAARAASQAYAAAKRAVAALPDHALDALRTERVPDAELREVVEAVCVLCGVKPDWAGAQLRLMPSAAAFRERLVRWRHSRAPGGIFGCGLRLPIGFPRSILDPAS